MDTENFATFTQETFATRLREAREANNMSIEDLAHRLGIVAQTVQNWENGQEEPRSNKMQTLSGILNVSLMWLLTGQDAQSPSFTGIGDMHSEEPLICLIQEVQTLQNDISKAANRLTQIEHKLRQMV